MFASRVQVPTITTIDFRKGRRRNFTSQYATVRNKKFLQQAAHFDGILFKSTSSANSQNVCFGLKSVNPLSYFFFFLPTFCFYFSSFLVCWKRDKGNFRTFSQTIRSSSERLFFPPLTYIFRPCSTECFHKA